jgi:hypothetical protein
VQPEFGPKNLNWIYDQSSHIFFALFMYSWFRLGARSAAFRLIPARSLVLHVDSGSLPFPPQSALLLFDLSCLLSWQSHRSPRLPANVCF